MPTPFFADLVRELAQDGGTGPLTPTGAVPGHRRFAGAVPADTDFHYAVAGVAQPAQWEVGTGHLDSAGRLVRAAVAASSSGGARVDFAPGLKTIALTVGAEWFETQAASVAAMESAGDAVAELADGLAGKQPLSTTHAAASTGADGDLVTVRRGADWVNIPLSTLAYRDAGGRLLAGAPVAGVDGSAAEPSVAFAADPDTGMFRPAANVLGLATGGVERVRVNASGHVGIGVDPANKLDVQTSAGRFSVANAGPASVKISSSGTMQYDTGAASAHQFLNNGVDSVAISSAGNVGIGTTTPENFGGYKVLHMTGTTGAQITLYGASDTVRGFLYTTASGMTVGTSTAHMLAFRCNNVERVVLETGGTLRPAGNNAQSFGSSTNRWLELWASKLVTPSGVALGLQAGAGGQWNISASTGAFYPSTDNALPVGGAANRASTVYAGTGTINTSDAREKTWRGAPTMAEMAAARRIGGELGFYQWNGAIADKGTEGARLHFGARAQAVWAIMAEEGLIDPAGPEAVPTSRYAFLCWDAWEAEGQGADGPARAAGDRFGIRPDQLALFLIAAQEARLAALEAAA
ncbi:tail fiber domain-containing protein [Sphingopyxis sp.]|uniref:tail fiber domain-containing protein n=1 Tax=Sphingopyxis sp. TaxID=1908224 RepID=UPI0035B15719